ncbi:MAG: glycan biosynthesis hexose transferase WsfD [Candidatus Krumholzibacteriia bacterium]
MGERDLSPPARRLRRPSPETVVFLLVAAVLIRQLLLPPLVGLADNGDFQRVLDPLGLQHRAQAWNERYFGWLGRYYVPGPSAPVQLLSSQLLLSGAAVGLGRLLPSHGVFDLRLQGGLQLVLYLLGLALILRAARTFAAPARTVIDGAVLLAATDVAYVAPLNSFYAEAATLVFLALLLGCALLALRDDRSRRFAVPGYLAAAALFTAAKPQNAFLAIPLAAVALAMLPRARGRLPRVAIAAGAVALVALGLFLHTRLPWTLRVRNLWNNVFTTILADSPDPRADLAEFGLDPALARFAGVPAFADSIPIEAATAAYGFADVLRFHLHHPGRFLRVASACARSAFVWRDPRLGNFPRAAGRPAGTLATDFAGWSGLEAAVLPRSLSYLAVFLGGVLVTGLVAARRHGVGTAAGGTAWLAAMLALAAGMQFGICVVGDGLYDIVKHLYLFQLLFDACLFASLAWAAGRLTALLPRL